MTTIARMLGDDWLLPELDERNRAFFTSGALMVQRCLSCDTDQHPPEDLCRHCGSHDVAPRASAGQGRVESAVVVHHAVHPALSGRVPYVVAVVSIDDAPGVHVVGNLRYDATDPISIGARVTVVFEEVVSPATGERLRIPQWRLSPGSGGGLEER